MGRMMRKGCLRHNVWWLPMVCLLLVSGGCADSMSWPWDRAAPPRTSGEWENPNKPWEAWDADRQECLQSATDRAEREFAVAQTNQTATFWSRTAPFEQSMSRFEAGQRRDELFARCMTDRGYRLVPRANPQGAGNAS